MFQLLRVIIMPSNELIQDYLIPSALRDPVAFTMGGVIVVYVHEHGISTCTWYKYMH
jgi:hypothetical protein